MHTISVPGEQVQSLNKILIETNPNIIFIAETYSSTQLKQTTTVWKVNPWFTESCPPIAEAACYRLNGSALQLCENIQPFNLSSIPFRLFLS